MTKAIQRLVDECWDADRPNETKAARHKRVHHAACEAVHDLEAALNPWRPISEAPKDEDILCYFAPDKHGFGGGFDVEALAFLCDFEQKPTHWMPLPAPPEQED